MVGSQAKQINEVTLPAVDANTNKFSNTTEVTQSEETHPAIDPDSNRFEDEQGYTFDANGNIVVDAEGRQFTFNGDNKQTEVKDDQNRLLGAYFYDGEGKRVKKLTFDEEGDPMPGL